MTHDDFIDFKTISEQTVRNLFKDDDGVQVYWTKVKQVTTTSDEPDMLQTKTNFDNQLKTNERIQKANPRFSINATCYGHTTARHSINKKNDLIAPCGLSPVPYRKF